LLDLTPLSNCVLSSSIGFWTTSSYNNNQTTWTSYLHHDYTMITPQYL
jgi:hypothetical protein